MERKLGEIDRARAVYSHASQICDPRVAPQFWQIWKEFEIKHGNEDTVREMLRIKRSVQAMYNTQVNFMSSQMLAAAAGTKGDNQETGQTDDMKRLEEKAKQLAEESLRDQPKQDKNILFVRSNATDEELGEMTKTTNPDEINIDSDFSSDEDENVEEIQVQHVPTEVFGGLAPEEED